ncbi:peptide chain release factor N(5)-glutamine methyltransferase [Clostridium polyendosporum]|nr:peptide chain release factor N(5)-glutamine methyltransferase [Clostridium polyendosporum]
MKKCQVGGQAVLEGVMMRGAKGLATAVRTPDGEIEVTFQNTAPLTKKYKILGMPVLRGFVALVDSLIEGVRALNYSASFFEEDDEPSKFEEFLEKMFGKKSNDILMGITFMISFIFAIGLFVAFPTGVTSVFKNVGLGVIGLNIVEGIIRVSILLLYMYLIGKMEDIHRLYQYHGAEHKTIFCYENELELTVDNVKKFKRFHPRCGTNFMFLVMLVGIFAFSFTGWNSLLERVASRIVLLPLVSGLTYELIKWVGMSDSLLSRLIAVPGLKLQELTTREPDDKQIEVAIKALKTAEGIKDEEKTIGELLEEGNKRLKESGIDSYVLDCQLLLGKVLKRDKLYIITHREEKIGKYNIEEFYSLVEKREKKMPLKYILQTCEFMGLELYIKEGVLIPRPDTEILVESVLEKIEEEKEVEVCDLCCGSGAIGLSIAYYRKNSKVDLIDIAEDPRIVTCKNISRFSLEERAEFIQSDLLKEVIKMQKRYDIIVSNPPYIRNDVIPTLMEDVREYEPHLALSGGEDGLNFYRRIIEESKLVLKVNGILAFEIGYDQGVDVQNLMLEKGFINVKIIKDLAYLDRVVIGELKVD